MKSRQLTWRVLCVVVVISVYLVACRPSASAVREGTATPSWSSPPLLSPTAVIGAPFHTPDVVSAQGTRQPPIVTPLTSTPVPTFTADEALAFIRRMQSTNGGVELPSWWGITPGETPLEEAQRVFAPLCSYASARAPYAAAGFGFHKYAGIDASVYGVHSGVVEEIWVFASVYGSDGSGRYFPFDDSWRAYLLDRVLAQLGPPSMIQVGFRPGEAANNNRTWLSELTVFYDELGFLIQYGQWAEPDDRFVRSCFSLDELIDIRIFIRVPPPDGFGGPPWDYGIDPLPLERATALSLEGFYENLRYEGACLESPIALWNSDNQ